MTKKIFNSIIFAAGIVLLASLIIIMGCLYDYFGSVQEAQLKDGLNLAASAVEEDGKEYLQKFQSDRYRITWIAADGTVLFDTQTGADQLENHADREEVQEALKIGEGKSTRYSATFLEKTIYYAKTLKDGSVLRISMIRATVGVLVLGMLQPILLVLITALILSGILASRLSKRIVGPLNNLDLEHPLNNDAYEELSPLLNRIHHQHQEITLQLQKLQQKTDEFAQITDNMMEGLILLNEKGTILSINPAAQKLFGVSHSSVGQDFLTLDRSRDVSLAIREALTDGHSEVHTEQKGREYQFDISRIESEHNLLGTVILTFDITEQKQAERIRREFTANVSHELKTPLQGIIGSAELIESGMVKSEDLPRFVGHIRREASRLVALIEDIIRLSQLDEENEFPREEVDLLEVAEETAASLHDAASSKNITFSVNGTAALISGVRRLLYEIVYNLCDNAIKYTRDGGHVQVIVSSEEKEAAVTVKDSGIGIPAEHQSHVFERFYRVDKSHSKASGGTGLGLSIVKHAVQYHHGTIELESEVNKGTAITVRFPK